jgi:hypothetical protein
MNLLARSEGKNPLKSSPIRVDALSLGVRARPKQRESDLFLPPNLRVIATPVKPSLRITKVRPQASQLKNRG